MPSLHLNGIDIYYEQAGTGPRLLLINGSGSTLEGSRPMFDLLAAQFDLVAHDQRGLGLTTIPQGPYTMADYAADAAAVAEAIGWDKYSVVGVSFGGMVAQELAVTFPQRIERLALVCTSPGGAGRASYPLHTLADLPAEERGAIGLSIMDTRFSPAWFADHPSDQFLADMMASRALIEKTPEMIRGEALQLEARSHHDVFDRLPRITCPTLVAGGRFDGIAPPANSEAIAAQVPNSELRLYEGGHAFFYQDPAAFPEIVAFLAG